MPPRCSFTLESGARTRAERRLPEGRYGRKRVDRSCPGWQDGAVPEPQLPPAEGTRKRRGDLSPAERAERLTLREIEVLQLTADGLSMDRIAARLEISPNTIRTHVQNALTKLGVHSKLEA